MSGTGQPPGLQPNPSDQHPAVPPQREASRNFTKASCNVRRAITRAFTKASTNLGKTRAYSENALGNNLDLNQIDGLRKENMAILAMIESDHYFFNIIENIDLILSPTERSSLRDVVTGWFAGKPREDTVTQIKDAIVNLESILTGHLFQFDNELSPQEMQDISYEVTNVRQNPDNPVDSNESLEAMLSDHEDYGLYDAHDEPVIMRYVPPIAQFDRNDFNGHLHPRQEEYQHEEVRQLVPRILSNEPERRPPHPTQAVCPACGGGHSLIQCEFHTRKQHCAVNELCIYCTSSRHKAFECQLKDLESSPDISGGRLVTRERPMISSTPKFKPPTEFRQKFVSNHDYSEDSDEDECRAPEERRHLRQSKKGLSLFDVNSIIPKFKGDPLQYKKFINLYENLVLKNPRLNATMKFSVLEGKLEGPAGVFLVDLDDLEEAIKETLEALRKGFDKDITRKAEILARIRDFKFHASDYQRMERQILELNTLILRLRERGNDVNSTFFVQQIVEKFPEVVWEKLESLYQSNPHPSISEVLDTFSKFVDRKLFGNRFRPVAVASSRNKEIPEETLMYASPSNKNSTQKGGKGKNRVKAGNMENANHRTSNGVNSSHQSNGFQQSRSPPTGNGSPSDNSKNLPRGNQSGGHSVQNQNKGPSKQKPKVQGIPGEVLEPCYKLGRGYDERFIAHTFPLDHSVATKCCFICGPGHSILQCPLSSYEVRQYFRKYGCCHNCAQRNHTTDNCQGFSRCTYCQGSHNTGACPLKEFYRDLKNYPSDAPAPVVNAFFRGPYGGSD